LSAPERKLKSPSLSARVGIFLRTGAASWRIYFPLLAGKKEELIFLDWSVEIPAEVVEPQLLSYGREEAARVKLVLRRNSKTAP